MPLLFFVLQKYLLTLVVDNKLLKYMQEKTSFLSYPHFASLVLNSCPLSFLLEHAWVGIGLGAQPKISNWSNWYEKRVWVFNAGLQLNSSPPIVPHMRQWIGAPLIQVMASLSPVRRQAFTWTNANLLSIGPLETNFSEIRIKIHNFSFMNRRLKMSSTKWRSFCPGS